MVLRFCQLKSLALVMLVALNACSFFSSQKDGAHDLLSPIKNDWFSHNVEHALHDLGGAPQPHNFFDINPELSNSNVYVNAFILTPEGSDHSYQLDLASGQRYYSHSYCPHSDIWSHYSGSISKPTFSIGVVPRLLDQLGEPQKVIIFGSAKAFSERTDFHEYRIRLVGAVIEQKCPEGNCLGKNNWISRMVFLGVDPGDKKFESVKNLTDLEKKVNWVKTKAVLENIDGRNGGNGTSYPQIRIGQPILLAEAMEYYKKRSIYLSVKETKKIRVGCQGLYDKLWDEVGFEQPEDMPGKTVEELNSKVKLITELKKKKKPIGFAARFNAFTKKYYTEYATCQRFIYSGNLNKDREKFWFLSYVGLFYQLNKDGYFFDCRTRSWQKNVLNNQAKPIFNIKEDMDSCKKHDFDLAMEYLPNFLTGLKNGQVDFYKFIDYDTHTFGTHQKLYSWVKVQTKKYDCNADPNPQIKKELKVFPDDVSWKERKIKDIADELKIIY